VFRGSPQLECLDGRARLGPGLPRLRRRLPDPRGTSSEPEGGDLDRHLIATPNTCGNRQQPRALVSVSHSTTCTASASARAHSGRPSDTHVWCPPPHAGTNPYASSPPETIGSGP